MKEASFFSVFLPCRWIWKSSSPQQCWTQPSWHHIQASATRNTQQETVKQATYSDRKSTQSLHHKLMSAHLDIRSLPSMQMSHSMVHLRRWACTLHWLWQRCCPVWAPAWSHRCMWRCIWPVERQWRKWHTDLDDGDGECLTFLPASTSMATHDTRKCAS